MIRTFPFRFLVNDCRVVNALSLKQIHSITGEPLRLINLFPNRVTVHFFVETFRKACLALSVDRLLYSLCFVDFLILHGQVFLERPNSFAHDVYRPVWSKFLVEVLSVQEISLVFTFLSFAAFLVGLVVSQINLRRGDLFKVIARS